LRLNKTRKATQSDDYKLIDKIKKTRRVYFFYGRLLAFCSAKTVAKARKNGKKRRNFSCGA
jgi:hypothetical protein